MLFIEEIYRKSSVGIEGGEPNNVQDSWGKNFQCSLRKRRSWEGIGQDLQLKQVPLKECGMLQVSYLQV